jgi:uncharacterized hydrophobic protein (TIGR00271 family)
MLHLSVYGRSATLAELGSGLEDHGTLRHVALAQGVRSEHSLLTGEISPESADAVLRFLRSRGIAQEDVALTRSDDIGASGRPRASGALIWADVFAQASANAEAVGRYLVFMIVAGVIAGFGVIEVNNILIVGAMAVSPDTLPITATCVGIVGRRGRLVRRALATLVVGLAFASLAAAALTAGLDLFDLLPSGFRVGESALSGLTTVNATTIGVALAAGVAGMLAVETRASAAVGVAISVTTIPAAAYLGVAAGVSEVGKASGALAVLAVNVVMIQAGGIATLLTQQWLARRRPAPVTGGGQAADGNHA